MSRAIDRHRMNRYESGLDALSGRTIEIAGDDEDVVYGDEAADARLYSGMLSELAKSIGGAVAQKKEQEAAAKKEAAEKASHAEADAAVAAAKAARKAAVMAAADAQGEADPKGPKHVAAAAAEAAAKVAEAKAAYYQQGDLSLVDDKHGRKGGSVPTWVWPVAGVAGAGLLGLIIWKLAGGRK